jgi:hypothetical protein
VATTFVKIQTVTVGSGGAVIEFTSIPQTYTDLKLIVSARNERAGQVSDDFKITINGNTGATYAVRRLSGNGASASSDGGSAAGQANAYSGVIVSATATASVFSSTEFYFPNYTSANNKSWSVDGVSENNNTTAQQSFYANTVNITDAITSIKIEGYNSANLNQYSTATLYGIKSS